MQKTRPTGRLHRVEGPEALHVLNPELAAPLQLALEAVQADDLMRAMRHFARCAEIDPENQAVLYFGSEAAQKAYFARKFGEPPMPPDLLQRWRDAAFTLTLACSEARPGDAVAMHNVGRFLDDELAPAHAVSWYRKALAIDREQVESWANLGTCLYTLGQIEEAERCWSKALAFEARNASGSMSQGYIWLRRGDFLRGWQALNHRWLDPQFQSNYGRKDLGGTAWTGQPLTKKDRLFLHGEQGLGDHVQFARYVVPLMARGVKVVGLETRAPLKRWFEEALADTPIVVYVKDVDTLPGFTHHAPLMSLPGLMGMEEIPPPLAPILWTAPNTLTPRPKRVGLIWKGATGNAIDAIRSIPDDLLGQLADIPGVMWVPLQYDPSGNADLTARAWLGKNVEASPVYPDVYALAQVLAGLDRVVTVDTLGLHVAGSLGVPTLALHRFSPEWRWGQEPAWTAWYPSVQHVVQPAPGDWAGVLTRVRTALSGTSDSRPTD